MTRFAKIQNDLCVSPTALADACLPLVQQAYNSVKKGLERYRSGATESWKYYEDGADARKKWVVVTTIPEQYRRRLEHHYGDTRLAYLQELLVCQALDRVQADDKPYFLGLKVKKGGRAFTSKEAADLAEACGWMRLINGEWWRDKWNGKTRFLADAAVVIGHRDLYGLKVSSGRVLGRRLNRWQKSHRDSLVPGKVGNSNAAKVTELGVKRLIDLYASPQKPDFVLVTRIYNQEAEEKGWNPLSSERVRQILSQPKNVQISFGHRNGTEVMRNKMERTIKRRRPSFPDALWVMDGTTIQLIYMEQGKVRSGLYVYYIMDAHSDAIIGLSIGTSEKSTLVQGALREACKNTMNLPYQLQYDNSAANKSAEVADLMDNLARVAFPTAPYNGKSKAIERVQGALEGLVMRYFPNWKGGNITASSLRTRANVDHIQSLIKSKDLPAKAGVMAQLRLTVEVWNNTADKEGVTRLDKYKKAHPKRKSIDYLMLVDLFWVKRKQSVSYTKDGLTMEVNGEKYTYEVEVQKGLEDMEFRKQYLGEKFEIKYDPSGLDFINLYKDGAWVATANLKYEMAMAVVDYKEDEGQILQASKDARSEYLKWQTTTMNAIKEEVRDEGMPVLSHQMVHKDAYNRIEQQLLDDLLEIVGEREEQPKRKKAKAHALYAGEGADGSIIE